MFYYLYMTEMARKLVSASQSQHVVQEVSLAFVMR